MSNLATNEKLTFSDDQLKLIQTQIAKDCTKDELALFLYQCKRTGLDPLTRQIYAIKRSGRMTIQTSIDGFRVIAERSGTYAGQDEPVFTYKADGVSILKCVVTVYRFAHGQRYPAGVGVAFYDEYYPNPINLQKTLKHTMIAKVAEALALRKAFPQDLSGLYTGDEMQQANTETGLPLMTKQHSKYAEALNKVYTAQATIDDVQKYFQLDADADAEMTQAQINAIKSLCDEAKLEDDVKSDWVSKWLNEVKTATEIVSYLKENYNIQFINQL